MVFTYEELKEYVREDFERFYEMGFQEEQIFSAVLDEYKHGKDFCSTENICIHIFLALNYLRRGLNTDVAVGHLRRLLTEESEHLVKSELGDEYPNYITDLKEILCV